VARDPYGGRAIDDRSLYVMRLVMEAMDQARRREQRELRTRGDRRPTHEKFLWLKHLANHSTMMRLELKRLRRSTLKAASAWALKESFWRI